MTAALFKIILQDAVYLAPWFVASFVLSIIATVLIRRWARSLAWLDQPAAPRKLHPRPVPLGGGLAIFAALTAVVLFVLLNSDALTSGEIGFRHYLGFFLGGLILMVGGFLDDKFSLPPRFSIIAPVLAALTVIFFGVEVEKLTNPFGGVVFLSAWQSNLLVFLWLMVVMYTMKFLDGLDGLATGLASIGAFMILALSLSAAYFQPDVALFSTIACGALLGFLIFNFNPASIFLGEGGSTFVGFLIGTLAVISGGKLATALLVIGIPFLDLIFVITRRVFHGGFKAAIHGDRTHLHHRLLAAGLSERKTVLLFYAAAGCFGVLTLFLQSREKLIVLGLLLVLFVLLAIGLSIKDKA
jgi:UDP-GlcNAc:undecaprenyl-phosphate GlcNAc-1-phosphate transferase